MAKWLAAALLPVLAAGLCGTDVSCQHEKATLFAPVLRLDKDTITQERCLPGHPATVYWLRKAGHTDIICESDITKLERGEVPLFYQYEECGEQVVIITYHIWYSHQPACLKIDLGPIHDEEYGMHPGDWETVAVHVRMGRVERVRFHQHSGSYTKARHNVEFVEGTEHPVVYVGQDSHGSYHDPGGTGNCAYFQDHRRWEDQRLKLEGWHFLLDVRNQSDQPEWFFADRKYFDDYPAPGHLGRRGCSDETCDGMDSWIAATGICTGKSCGCRKSDWCTDVTFGQISEEKPCDDTMFNDFSERGKDLLQDLFSGSNTAQVSRADDGMRALAAASLVLGGLLLS